MNDIICPNCEKAFKVDETGYANIMKQVRDSEFEQEINERLKRAKEAHDGALQIAKQQANSSIQSIKADKELEIERLNSELRLKESSFDSRVTEAVNKVERENDRLKNKLETANLVKIKDENALKKMYETQIEDRDAAIERLRDLKAKLSTKMVGESLEQHCQIEFEKLRPTAFQKATFGKDNDASSGSKGDYIFKEFDENKTEIVSIMFEMKNENDTTQTKSKNEDFLKELDKDRNEKGCEYAVLVSLLEQDNELYNTGIVDMSHRYPKMYVIRPQFFIPMITLLRNAAMNALTYKNQLAIAKAQNIDVTNFETEFENWRQDMGRNYDLASRKYDTAIAEIDKSIKNLEKTKAAMLGSEKNFRILNDKAQAMTIKKLTKNSPSLATKFEDEIEGCV